ncbi:hypothetical protein NPIL_329161 [Nephila pilipes]|uniref:Uncharacterized protein n=1 Tax=Nephila pilipes TaxID=299642 RepID=A0A8X6Q8A2_NEPPI|nr:hypothetical protein NPIL_329161 [Nephila pilipes]
MEGKRGMRLPPTIHIVPCPDKICTYKYIPVCHRQYKVGVCAERGIDKQVMNAHDDPEARPGHAYQKPRYSTHPRRSVQNPETHFAAAKRDRRRHVMAVCSVLRQLSRTAPKSPSSASVATRRETERRRGEREQADSAMQRPPPNHKRNAFCANNGAA